MVGGKIGRGAFAEVRHALRKSDKKPCTEDHQLNLDHSDNVQLQGEIMMMLSMKHRVLSCHAVFKRGANMDELWVVMPYMNLGSALRVISICGRRAQGTDAGKKHAGH